MLVCSTERAYYSRHLLHFSGLEFSCIQILREQYSASSIVIQPHPTQIMFANLQSRLICLPLYRNTYTCPMKLPCCWLTAVYPNGKCYVGLFSRRFRSSAGTRSIDGGVESCFYVPIKACGRTLRKEIFCSRLRRQPLTLP